MVWDPNDPSAIGGGGGVAVTDPTAPWIKKPLAPLGQPQDIMDEMGNVAPQWTPQPPVTPPPAPGVTPAAPPPSVTPPGSMLMPSLLPSGVQAQPPVPSYTPPSFSGAAGGGGGSGDGGPGTGRMGAQDNGINVVDPWGGANYNTSIFQGGSPENAGLALEGWTPNALIPATRPPQQASWQPPVSQPLPSPPPAQSQGPPPPPTTLSTTAPGATQFSASNNLIGGQFNPLPSLTTSTAQGQLSGAQKKLADWQGFTPYSAVGTGDQSGINQQQGQAGQLFQGANVSRDPSLLNQAQGLVQGAGLKADPSGLGQARQLAQGAGLSRDPALLNDAQGLVRGANLQGTGGLLDQSQQQLGGAKLGPLAGMGSDTGAARSQLGSLLGGISGAAPNRLQIAQDAFQTFQEQQANKEKRGIQGIARANAAAGRLGSGMVSTDLGNLEDQLNQERLQAERGLAGDVASQSLQDRLNAVQGTQGALGQLGGLDLSQQGLGLQAGTTEANLALSRSGALQGLAGQQFGQNQAQAGQQLAQAGALQSLQGQGFNQGAQTAQQQLAQSSALQGLQGQEFGQAGQAASQDLARAGALQGLQGQGFNQGATAAQQQLAQGSALQGLAGQQFGQQQSLRGEQRTDQGNLLASQQANLAGLQGQTGQLAGLQQQGFGQDQANYGQLANERNYQSGLQNQALQNQLEQFGLEQGAQNQDFTQQQDVNSLLSQLGFGGNSTGTLAGLSDLYSQQGADLQSGGADMLQGGFQQTGGGGIGGLLSSLLGGGQDPNAGLTNTGITKQMIDQWTQAGQTPAQINALIHGG